jgi:transcriptional regulator EpsA
MNQAVILSAREQECLLRVIEAAPQVRALPELFLWAQGQIQTLLPHRLMVCLQFEPDGALRRLDCLHASALDAAALRHLCDPQDGLAIRLARAVRDGHRLPCMIAVGDAGAGADPGAALAPFQSELEEHGYDNLMLHGSGPLHGVSSLFALFDLPFRPHARHAYFFELLLPQLHLALLRLAPTAARADPGRATGIVLARPLSAREAEILGWVREGKSNYEVACILGLSSLTVKNHLQRIYRLLGVSNRTHALARCLSLRLLGADPVAAGAASARVPTAAPRIGA